MNWVGGWFFIEVEWEVVVKVGEVNVEYFWGLEKFDVSVVNLDGVCESLFLLGSYLCGNNCWGFWDMCGNVWEWC